MKNNQKNKLVHIDQHVNQQKPGIAKNTFKKFNADQVCNLFKYELQQSDKDFDDNETLTGILIW